MTSTEDLARQIVELGARGGKMVATAESCTGGMIAAALTDIPGSSAVVDRGFVTYSNQAKEEMLGVPARILQDVGAVSEETARAMAEGALARSRASFAVAVTGIAGPDGGSQQKPVGLVWFGLAARGQPTWTGRKLFGDIGRDGVRRATVLEALGLVLQAMRRGGNQDDDAATGP
jgi:nicotinamide-nucleotide amidase